MREQIDDFLCALREEKGYSNNTIVAYRNDLCQFCDFTAQDLGATSWDRVTRKHLAHLCGPPQERSRIRFGYGGPQSGRH